MALAMAGMLSQTFEFSRERRDYEMIFPKM
jgi:hypothetical protein